MQVGLVVRVVPAAREAPGGEVPYVQEVQKAVRPEGSALPPVQVQVQVRLRERERALLRPWMESQKSNQQDWKRSVR